MLLWPLSLVDGGARKLLYMCFILCFILCFISSMILYALYQPKAISGSPLQCLPVSEMSMTECQQSCTKFVEMKISLRTNKLPGQLQPPLFFCPQKLLADRISTLYCEVAHLDFEFCFSLILSIRSHLRVFEKVAPMFSQSLMVMCHARCAAQDPLMWQWLFARHREFSPGGIFVIFYVSTSLYLTRTLFLLFILPLAFLMQCPFVLKPGSHSPLS